VTGVQTCALPISQHAPWLVPHRVLFHDVACRFCFKSICPEGHHRCLDAVSPERVVRAVHELIDEKKIGNEANGNNLKWIEI
jgi:hypothetical protein